MHNEISILIIISVVAALAFDFLNGFHDAANSIATVVSTRVLSPRQAVAWAAFFNVIAGFFFHTGVAKTIQADVVQQNFVDPTVVLAALLGAIVWNIVTWIYGLPSSSSHALIGGMIGAGLARGGLAAIVWPEGGFESWKGIPGAIKTMVVSPIVGFGLAFVFMGAVMWIFRRWTPFAVDKLFRRLQLVSAGLYSLGHGGNDAQKTMGIIMALLVSVKVLPGDLPDVPWWIKALCYCAMGLGTLSGGWRIVKTMGSKMTKLKPVGGFCAESAGAVTIIANTFLKLPVSTTHVITGSIMGVGATRRLSAVKWGVTGRIMMAWVLTIPAAAVVAALAYGLLRGLGAGAS
jgi:PiT family inorganic phosphate transporter